MYEISSMEQYVTVIREADPVVMLFSADWCPDCRYLDTFMDEVVKDYEGSFTFYHVNSERFPELCQTFDVMGIPSFLAYQNGQMVGRFVNRNRKTKAEVEGFLREVKASSPQAADETSGEAGGRAHE